MDKITIRFTSDSGMISKIIRLFTWSSFSHVDYIASDNTIIGCWPTGGVKRHNIKPTEMVYAEFEVHSRTAFENFIFEQLGKPYDWGAIFGLVFRLGSMHDTNKWFCSELIAEAASVAGTELIRKDASRVTPQDLWESALVKPL